MNLGRRHALCCGAALGAGLFSSLLATPAQAALRNPCRGALPPALAQHPVVLQAFEGINAERLVDTHAHLLGNGDSGSGCTVHESMHQWWRPTEVLRRRAILNAACVEADAPSIDRAYVQRLQELAAGFPAGARWWLYAFDRAHDNAGQPDAEHTTFHVPNAYAERIARENPGRFEWVASVHPYREDAVPALAAALDAGAVALKWLPSAMNIDLADARCKPVYELLARRGVPVVVHCGEEKAVPGAEQDAYGNPLAVRAPLALGVRVIVAHCASLGRARDTERRSAPLVPAFDLFARLMDEPAHRGLLFGDLSAVFQRNREPAVWQAVLQRRDWHARLLHGSDHPLPGLMPLFSPPALVKVGLLAEADAPVLQAVREHNALLFDFMLKRRLRWQGQGLPSAVFEAAALSPRPATVAGG
jgi:mannonate dehydratase